nr:MAG TPA: hypothetical protein [Caudoviricetes sp.]DAR32269.1 MAG TPA: hypothetical protein [Caudoviricetes sp.]
MGIFLLSDTLVCYNPALKPHRFQPIVHLEKQSACHISHTDNVHSSERHIVSIDDEHRHF